MIEKGVNHKIFQVWQNLFYFDGFILRYLNMSKQRSILSNQKKVKYLSVELKKEQGNSNYNLTLINCKLVNRTVLYARFEIKNYSRLWRKKNIVRGLRRG